MDGRGFEESVRSYADGTKLEAGGASLPRKRADGKRACWSNGRNECRRSGSSLGRRLAAWRCYVRKGSYTGSVADGNAVNSSDRSRTARSRIGSVYHARRAYSLVVIGLGDYALDEEQRCQPPLCVAGRRRLADLRHLLRGQDSLCLQDAHERIDGRFVVRRLLRPAAIAQGKHNQQTHDHTDHHPKWFPSHLEYPL